MGNWFTFAGYFGRVTGCIPHPLLLVCTVGLLRNFEEEGGPLLIHAQERAKWAPRVFPDFLTTLKSWVEFLMDERKKVAKLVPKVTR